MSTMRGPLGGVLFLVASNGLTASVDSVAKHLSRDLHGVQIAWGYAVAIAVALLAWSIARPTPLRQALATRRPALQLARPAMLMLTISTLFVGIAHLPLADAVAISFTAPLFITVLSIPLLGERVGVHRWLAVVAGLVGVVVIVRPGEAGLHWAVSMPLVSAVFFALFQIMTRQLAATERTTTTLLYTGFGGAVWGSMLVPFFWSPLAPGHLLVFALTGLLGVAAHLCMIKAYEFTQASLLAPFNYVKLVWASLLGFAAFGEIPGTHVTVGAAIIVASGLYVLQRERRAR